MLLFTGALTSKPYAFTARPWELRSVESVDILDGIGSNIRIDFKETEILRILPRRNSEINEYWISDKIRFFYDGLKRQRLLSPFEKKNGELKKIKWSSILSKLLSLFKVYCYEYGSKSIGILANSNIDLETLFLLRSFSNRFGFFLSLDKSHSLNIDNPLNYRFNTKINSLENVDFCLFIGTNPRFEAAVLNLRLRKIFRRGSIEFASIGGNFSTTFPVSSFGLTSKILLSLVEGKHILCKKLVQAKTPVLIFGSKLLERTDGSGIFSLLQSVSNLLSSSFFKGKTVFNPLVLDSNLVGALDLGFQSSIYVKKNLKLVKFLYAVGLDNSDLLNRVNKKKSSVLFQTSHGNSLTKTADFVFPSAAFTEKAAIYLNCEGRPQKTQRALVGPNLAQDDWKIICAFFDLFNVASSRTKVDFLSNLSTVLPISIYANNWFSIKKESLFDFNFLYKSRVCKSYLKLTFEDFYMKNSLCQSSRVMAKASDFLRFSSTNYKFLIYGALK